MLPQTIQSFAGDRSTPTSRPRPSQPYLPFQSGHLSAPVRTLPPQNREQLQIVESAGQSTCAFYVMRA